MRRRLGSLAWALALAVALVGPGGAPPAAAAEHAAYLVTSPYPGVSAEPGASLKLDLEVWAPATESVDLAVTEAPEGWSTVLRGGGFVVSRVTAAPDEATRAQLSVDVPFDAAPGDYRIVVTETGSAGTSRLELVVSVAEVVDAGIGLTADFPSLKGDPSDTFTYTLTVENNTPSDQTFDFEPAGPQGWTVTASPVKQARAASLTIEAGATEDVRIEAEPPASVSEGSYELPVLVTAANGAQGRLTLTAVVTGAGQLDLRTSTGILNSSGHANEEKTETLLVSNVGTADLTDVKLSATAPTDWEVTFSPDTLDSLSPGTTTQVVATIKPAKDAVVGDYAIGVRATAGSEAQSLDLRYRVTTSSLLGWIGVVMIVVAAGAVIGVYRRFGRR